MLVHSHIDNDMVHCECHKSFHLQTNEDISLLFQWLRSICIVTVNPKRLLEKIIEPKKVVSIGSLLQAPRQRKDHSIKYTFLAREFIVDNIYYGFLCKSHTQQCFQIEDF